MTNDVEKGFLGIANFQYIVDSTLVISGSKTENIRQPGYSVLITQITVDVYADGLSIPLNVATDLEKITVQISNAGKNLFSSSALTVAQLSTIGQSDLFKPFIIPQDAAIEITFTHTAKAGGTAYGTSLEVFLGFHGEIIS